MINPEELERIFMNCLFADFEMDQGIVDDPAKTVIVEGITATYGFNRARLETHRQEVIDMINQLPDTFQVNGGGGQSFLQMCVTKDGTQWGEHRDMEKLLTLAIGLDIGGYCMPRQMWQMFPGGMPYVWFNTPATVES